MPIPPSVAVKILRLAVKSASGAYRGATLVRKAEIKRVGGYIVEIVRRNTLGADGGISQMVSVFNKNKVRQAVWHIVVKAGKVIHQHLDQL